jgi:hypothetical protein
MYQQTRAVEGRDDAKADDPRPADGKGHRKARDDAPEQAQKTMISPTSTPSSPKACPLLPLNACLDETFGRLLAGVVAVQILVLARLPFAPFQKDRQKTAIACRKTSAQKVTINSLNRK